MKKLILSVVALLGLNLMMHAQTTAPAKAAKVKSEKAVPPAKVAGASATTKVNTLVTPTTGVKANATPKASAIPLKKDGTPDKRYKAKAGPVKKDGTPDKRFKAKAGPVKKDGTPDKRFKANQ